MTDVMFPGGSPELVEPIYKNSKLSAPFNEQLTAIVCDYVRHRLLSLGGGDKVGRNPPNPAAAQRGAEMPPRYCESSPSFIVMQVLRLLTSLS